GMKEGAPSPTLATDIFPTITVEPPAPEWAFLAGERLGWMRWYDTAAEGEYSHVGLRNPAGSGVLIVVKEIAVGFGATCNFHIGMRGNSAVDTQNPGYSRDSRLALQGMVGEVVTVTQVAAGIYPMWQGIVLNNVQYVFSQPIVLHPCWEVLVHPSIQNTSVTGSFVWTERPIEQSETR
ncbi:unnamed protein product, partial [marine sediment metagenome]